MPHAVSLALALTLAVVGPARAPQGEGSGDDRGVLLARGGRARCTIVLPRRASRVERKAADTLAAHLLAITRAEFPFAEEGELVNTPGRILIGPSRSARERLPDLDWASLGDDGVVLHTAGQDLIVAGSSPSGTRNAVYTLLEEELGCRWWTADAEDLPVLRNLRVGPLVRAHVPPFELRRLDVEAGFAERLRLSGEARAPRSWDLVERLPFEREFPQHPDWFAWDAERETRVAGPSYCLSSIPLARWAAAGVARQLEGAAGSSATVEVVVPPAAAGSCACPSCSTTRERSGSEAGVLLRFANRVAETLEPRHSDASIAIAVRGAAVEPPGRPRPRPDVVVMLDHDGRKQFVPIESARLALPSFQSWSELCRDSRLWVREDTTNRLAWIAPHPVLTAASRNVRTFADLGVRGVDFRGDGASPVADLSHMKSWVLAHLLWDPELDEGRLRLQFLEGYYGSAVGFMRAYVETLEQEAARSKAWTGSQEWSTRDWLSLKTLNKLTRLFEKAKEAVASDPVILDRVRAESLSVDWVWLQRWGELRRESRRTQKPFLGPVDPVAAARELVSTARELGAERHAEEDAGLDNLEAELVGRLRRGTFTPPQEGIYEAEHATLHRVEVLDQRAGFTGDGYVSFPNAARDFVQWMVRVRRGGPHRLVVRFAHVGGPRPAEISVDDELVERLFEGRGRGGAVPWSTVEVRAELPAGASRVRLYGVHLGAVGESRLLVDHLRVVAE